MTQTTAPITLRTPAEVLLWLDRKKFSELIFSSGGWLRLIIAVVIIGMQFSNSFASKPKQPPPPGKSTQLPSSHKLSPHLLSRDRIGGIEFVSYQNKLTVPERDEDNEVVGVQIETGLNRTVRKKINDVLKEWFDNANQSLLDCSEVSHRQNVSVLSNTWLTILISDSRYCGGAHAYTSSSALIFDLRTGESVNLAELIDYPALTRSAKKGAIRQEYDIGDDCIDYLSRTSWDTASFWLSKKSMEITLDISAPDLLTCNATIEISFKAFRRVIRPAARPLYDRYVAHAKKAVEIATP